MNDRELRKNGEGYSDPTAYEVLAKMDEEVRFHRLLNTIFYLCDLAGFHLENRIILKDNKTGRIWE